MQTRAVTLPSTATGYGGIQQKSSSNYGVLRQLQPLAMVLLATTALTPLSLSAQSLPPQGVGLQEPISPRTRPGDQSFAYGVSADGSVVVGVDTFKDKITDNPVGLEYAFRYTAAGGHREFADGIATGVSADGTIIVGATRATARTAQAYRWTQATGIVGIGYLATNGTVSSFANGISADGTTIVGTSGDNDRKSQAFRWTQATGIIGLGFLGQGVFGTYSEALAASADGSVVVGFSTHSGGTDAQAFRWTQASGLVGLGFLPGTNRSEARAVSRDGLVVVGGASLTGTRADTSPTAFRWTPASGMVSLGYIGVGGTRSSIANGTSADGAIIVGNSNSNFDLPQAFRWTQASGIQNLNTLLTFAGVSLGGWDLTSANAITPDGQFIIGTGTDPSGLTEGYIVRYAGTGVLPVFPITIGLTGRGSATAVNSDGTVAAVTAGDLLGPLAFRWTSTRGTERLNPLPEAPNGPLDPEPRTAATGVSADGSVVVGSSTFNANFGQTKAVYWKNGVDPTSLGFIGTGGSQPSSIARGISADGQTIVGESTDSASTASFATRAFRWTQGTGIVALGPLPGVVGGFGVANAVNADGSVIVGGSTDRSGGFQAFRSGVSLDAASPTQRRGGPWGRLAKRANRRHWVLEL